MPKTNFHIIGENPVEKQFFNYFMDSLLHFGVTKRWVNGINEDKLGNIWIAIDAAGLLRVSMKTKSLIISFATIASLGTASAGAGGARRRVPGGREHDMIYLTRMLGKPVEGWRRPQMWGYLKDTGRFPLAGLLKPASSAGALLGLTFGGYYMYKLYRIKARPFWDHWQTGSSFAGTALSLGGLLLGLLALGLGGRLAAATLFVFNIIAVISYPELNEVGVMQHQYWGVLLLIPLLYGPGKLSIDCFIKRWLKV